MPTFVKKKKDYWLAQEIKSRDRGADCHLLLPAVTLGGWSQRERERDLHLISLYLLFCKDFFWSYHQQTNTHFDFIIHEEVKMVLGVLQIIPSLLFQSIADFSKLITEEGLSTKFGILATIFTGPRITKLH